MCVIWVGVGVVGLVLCLVLVLLCLLCSIVWWFVAVCFAIARVLLYCVGFGRRLCCFVVFGVAVVLVLCWCWCCVCCACVF